jgi:NAD(P)H-hydrate epimerase
VPAVTPTAFLTEGGVEVPAISASTMREIDRLTVEGPGPNLYQMMENAGRNLAGAAMAMARERDGPVVILAGTGGNGGGGICAGRHLANRGVEAAVAVTDPARLGPVPADQLAVFRLTPGRVVDVAEISRMEPALVIDAVVGYGLAGPPRGPALEMIRWAGSQDAPVLSLEAPSGLDVTTGEKPGEYVAADATLTLALPKTSLDDPAAGELWLADLGIPVAVFRQAGVEVPPGVYGPHYRVRIRAG